jgi:hypothetical protein
MNLNLQHTTAQHSTQSSAGQRRASADSTSVLVDTIGEHQPCRSWQGPQSASDTSYICESSGTLPRLLDCAELL